MPNIHSPFTLGLAGVLYAKLHKLPVVATLHSQYKQDCALAKAKAMGLKNFRMLFAGKGQDEEKLASLVREQDLTEEVSGKFSKTIAISYQNKNKRVK